MAENAGTTYGTDQSSENHFGLGYGYRSPHERMLAARGSAAAAPTISVWLIGVLVLAALVWL
jgi:hypothetical protein